MKEATKQSEREELLRDIGILLSILRGHLEMSDEELAADDAEVVADIEADHVVRANLSVRITTPDSP